MNPKVSVIVPVYNVEKHIEKCARSLFEQTFDEIEYIFVDDASLDRSIDILMDVMEKYPARKAYCNIIRHENNRGQATSRNTGLSASKGEYIIYCDSDDWMEITMVEEMYRKAISDGADIVSCNFRMVWDDMSKDFKTVDWGENKVKSLKAYIEYTWTMLWNLMVKKSIYTDNGLMLIEGMRYCEDFNLSVKLLLNAKKIVHLEKVLYNYNQQNSGSVMHTLERKSMYDEIYMTMDVINYFKEKGVYDKFAKPLCWRILKGKQELVLDTDTYDEFLSIHPDSHRYIWSCPFINTKLKIMMWSLTHHMGLIARFLLVLRNTRKAIA